MFSSTIQLMWRHADAVYDTMSEEYNKKTYAHSIKIKDLNTDIDFIRITEYIDKIVIAFRGTTDLDDWINNFAFVDLGDKSIHFGFYDSWRKIQPLLKKELVNFSFEKPIYITGHSRGAALSLLCAEWLKLTKTHVFAFCFGCPRVGNHLFANRYNALNIDTLRVTYGYDMVTNLPTESMGYVHVGREVKIKVPFWHRWFNKIKDHRAVNYRKSILK